MALPAKAKVALHETGTRVDVGEVEGEVLRVDVGINDVSRFAKRVAGLSACDSQDEGFSDEE